MITQAPVRFDVSNFAGAVKLIDPRLLQDNIATEAVNCELEAGTISSIKAPSKVKDVASTVGTIFINNGILYEFAGDCDVVASPVGDTVGRFYLTDGTKPKKTDKALYPTLRDIKIEPPIKPITASGSHLSGSTVVATVSYYYTYVTDWGEESIPSPESTVFEIYDEIDIDLSNMSVPTGTDQHITKKRIYRLAIGTQGAEYQFLTEIDAATTTYRDQTATADLGDVCPTETWLGPADDLKGLTYIGNGYTAGFRENEVYISEPFIPYAYPIANMFSFSDPVVSLGVFGQTLVVGTKDKVGILYGIDPRAVSQDSYPESYPCLSKASMVSMADCVIFASTRGLIHASAQGVNLLTKDIWSETDWTALEPSKLIGVAYRGRYYGFFKGTAKGFILDFRSALGGNKYPTIIELDLSGAMSGVIDNVASDGENNKLYILTSGSIKSIYEYAASATDLEYQWQSKTFVNDSHCNLGAGKVNMNGTGILYYDSGQVAERQLNNYTIFRLPTGHKSYEFSFKIVGTGTVRSVSIGDSMRCLNGVEQ